jgi:hypothetical protein
VLQVAECAQIFIYFCYFTLGPTFGTLKEFGGASMLINVRICLIVVFGNVMFVLLVGVD